jgi:hypothetical protein
MRKFILPAFLICSFVAFGIKYTPRYFVGESFVKTDYSWPSDGIVSDGLGLDLDLLKNPSQISKYLVKNYAWKDNYDTRRFLTPNEFFDRKSGVCSAFARFWQYANDRNGTPTKFIAMWGPISSHAVAIFKSDDQRWRMASNQFYYQKEDLDPNNLGSNTAIVNAAKFFYDNNWSVILIYDDSGTIIDKMTNVYLKTMPNPGSVISKNLFSIKDR